MVRTMLKRNKTCQEFLGGGCSIQYTQPIFSTDVQERECEVWLSRIVKWWEVDHIFFNWFLRNASSSIGYIYIRNWSLIILLISYSTDAKNKHVLKMMLTRRYKTISTREPIEEQQQKEQPGTQTSGSSSLYNSSVKFNTDKPEVLIKYMR